MATQDESDSGGGTSERGYRPAQILVPDVRAAEFADEASRQSALVAGTDPGFGDQDFVESVSVSWDED